MANQHEYICNGCGKASRRDMLTVKKTVFASMGEGASITRSRVKQWLCIDCVKVDPDWNLPPHRQPAERAPASSLKTEEI